MGVIVANWLMGKVVRVKRFNDESEEGQYCY